ncbi:MAG: AAA family ATPase [Planctomycetota bacterium]
MNPSSDPTQGLRDALRVSPENVPLRRHLAETLMGLGRAPEAEAEYREALKRSPEDTALKLGLASAFDRQGKSSAALVIVEDLVKRRDTPASAFLLHARLLLKGGDAERAVRAYKSALDADPDSADPELASRLGIGAGPDSAVSEGRLRAGGGDREERPESPDVERPKIAFADVGGMDALKEEIRLKIIHPLANPEIYRAYGKPLGGGILMYGPPGCGKTHLARATAGEVRAGFLSIGIHDVLDMWIGSSERNLHGIFDNARSHKPCVLFFDEVDALGASRTDMRQAGGRHIINQFLSELDGATSSNDGVLVLAATNAPWHLDSAFRRPGRFDRILFVPPPDAPARASILGILCAGKPQGTLDFEAIAARTDGFSGADLKSVVDVAIERKLSEAMKKGALQPLATRDLIDAAKSVKPSTKEWFATARNYALYSNAGGIYDDILKYLKM